MTEHDPQPDDTGELTEEVPTGLLARLRARSESGYVLIMTALLVVPILAFTAMAIDLGSWYAQATKMQRTADAASLAGVVWVSGNTGSCPNGYVCVAQATSQKNGYTDGVNGVSVTPTALNDSQLKVTISAPAPLWFGKLFMKSQTLTRTATAEYVTPIPMGSPSSNLGNDPQQLAAGYNPQLWLNIAGWASHKSNGDQNTASYCDAGMFGCTGTAGTGQNTDYLNNGYTFYVNSTGVGSGNLNIDVYDPGFVNQGDQCTIALNAADAATAVTTWSPGDTAAGIGTKRYDGTSLDYCPGDTDLGNDGTTNAQVQTTYIVRAPDNTPLDDYDNPPICAISFTGYHPTDEATLKALLSGANPATGTEQEKVGTWYHQWYTICGISNSYVSSHPGNYVVQVRTNADVSSPVKKGGPGFVSDGSTISIGSFGGTESTVTYPRMGHNRWALRSGWAGAAVGSAAWSTKLSTAAAGHLPIYVNAGTVSGTYTPSFYLARVPTKYAAKTVQLDFWDLGDVGGTPATVDFNLTGTADVVNMPNNCTFKRDGVLYGTGQFGTTISGCSVSGVTSANFNGHMNTATITLPANYSCADASASGCWIKVNLTYHGTPTDTTTWSARILGDPVHLVA